METMNKKPKRKHKYQIPNTKNQVITKQDYEY